MTTDTFVSMNATYKTVAWKFLCTTSEHKPAFTLHLISNYEQLSVFGDGQNHISMHEEKN